MDAVMYLRSAGPNQADIVGQREACEAFAHQHGYELTDAYTDLGRTRLALRALTDDASTGRFSAVFACGLSRIGRTLPEFTRTTETLREAGCTLYDAATGTVFEPESAAARFMLGVLSAVAELDAESIERERRTRRALAH